MEEVASESPRRNRLRNQHVAATLGVHWVALRQSPPSYGAGLTLSVPVSPTCLPTHLASLLLPLVREAVQLLQR